MLLLLFKGDSGFMPGLAGGPHSAGLIWPGLEGAGEPTPLVVVVTLPRLPEEVGLGAPGEWVGPIEGIIGSRGLKTPGVGAPPGPPAPSIAAAVGRLIPAAWHR